MLNESNRIVVVTYRNPTAVIEMFFLWYRSLHVIDRICATALLLLVQLECCYVLCVNGTVDEPLHYA